MEYSLRSRMLAGFVAMMVVVVGGAAGYYLIGDGRWAYFDCVYMTVITMTTVGFGETLPGMEAVAGARAYTIVLLVFGTGILVYFASTVTAFIIEGDLRNLLQAQRFRKRIRKMKDHVVVCGAGSTGQHIIKELIGAGVPVIAIDRDEAELKHLADTHPRAPFVYIVGDATDDDVLAQAALSSARGLVAALSNDKDNLYLIIATRQVNTTARVIGRAAELSHVDKLKRAGADAVVSPNYIGGMRMVSEMLRPAVVRFLDEMLRDKRAMYRIEEITIEAGSPLAGKTLREAAIRDTYGMTVLAVYAGDDQPWIYNPEASQGLRAGMVLVVLGSSAQVARLRDVQ